MWSGRYHVFQSAKMAYHATVNFLESIRDAVVDPRSSFPGRGFSEFIGLVADGSTTLCFVIDTSATMYQEIEAIKQLTINLTRKASMGLRERPSDYLLSPFSDLDVTNPGIYLSVKYIHVT